MLCIPVHVTWCRRHRCEDWKSIRVSILLAYLGFDGHGSKLVYSQCRHVVLAFFKQALSVSSLSITPPYPSDVSPSFAANCHERSKHMAEQKRGVTTSYKSEELYTQFRKIGLFLVVLGLFSGIGAHGIDKCTE